MANNSSRLQRLIFEIKKLSEAHPRQSEPWRLLEEQVAELLMDVLRDEGHPLTQNLADLQALEVGPGPHDDDRKKFKQDYNQDRRFLTPTPGSRNADLRRFWPLQLLLHVAARSSHRPCLVELLRCSEHAIEKAADQARAASIGLWTASQYAGYLLEAVGYLTTSEPQLELAIDGRTLTYGPEKVRLSKQAGQFMRLLLKYRPSPIPLEELKQAGIHYPGKARERFGKAIAKRGIELNIIRSAGSYAILR